MHRFPHADAYAVLGVAPTADDAQLRAAYRRAVRTAHPDAGAPAAAFHAVQAAWEQVRTPELRAAYDARRRRGRPVAVLPAEPLGLPGRAPEGWPDSMLDRRSGGDRRAVPRAADRRRPVKRFTRPAVAVPARFVRFDAGARGGAPGVDVRV